MSNVKAVYVNGTATTNYSADAANYTFTVKGLTAGAQSTIKVEITDEDGDLVFDLMLNDYLVYIEGGRRIGAKFPPIKPIVEWAKRRGIPTDNSTIFLIRRAISRDGIRPRPFMEFIFEEMDEFWNSGEWSDKIFDKIMEKIDNFFNQ